MPGSSLTTAVSTPPHSIGGYCQHCRAPHTLGVGRAADEARRMMEGFHRTGRLDFERAASEADPRLTGTRMWEPEGRMFGVLDCEDDSGNPVFLRAYSSLPRRTQWLPGWVPPLIDRTTHAREFLPVERRIKHLTRRLKRLADDSPERQDLSSRRRTLSRSLNDALNDRRFVRNRNGAKTIREAFAGPRTMPGGVGDCCAPKLLTHAARLGLRPRGIAEFFWGGTSTTENRVSGRFYSPCENRCRPLLGFLLCGLEA